MAAEPSAIVDDGAASWLGGDAVAMAEAVRSGRTSATALVGASLARIAATDARINAFTDVIATRALERAARLDARLTGGGFEAASRAGPGADRDALPLAGVPVAVKNLFDLAGLRTLAGSRIERDAAPATRDAVLVARLEAAGAIVVGALNMDEYAYGFTTENSHEGPTRNPHDPTRIAGGSSGGSGAAVAAGQVPLTLGSDTNGSIRVPASLCGVFGLKPTFGRLPRTGTWPFVSSLDHLGPLGRSVRDLAVSYDAMQGPEPAGGATDPGCAQRPVEPTTTALDRGADGLRIAVLGGWFHDQAGPEARAAVAEVAAVLGATTTVDLPWVEAGRAAAFLITNAEGAALHLPDLRRRPADFEPLSRGRFLAGALLPAAWVARAQRVRRRYAEAAADLLGRFDLLIAPATPCPATPIGADTLELNGQRLPLRPNLGLLTQPISCIGLPVCAVPVRPGGARLPIGVQLIAAPWREDSVLAAAFAVERAGLARAPVAAP